MTGSRNRRNAKPRVPSEVDPVMLARYRRAARAPTGHEDLRLLMSLTEDYHALVDVGDGFRALGAGIELIDVALRIAATPATDAHGLTYKIGFFERFFPSMAQTLHHPHAARVADAAIAAERALAEGRANARH